MNHQLNLERCSLFVLKTLALAALFTTGAVWAQGGILEEIIVTAEFREANVQDTPLAISAITADMLEARSQTNLAQIAAQMPNVSLRPAGSSAGNSLIAFIRGIGQTDFNPSVEPGVGIYVDDVYYSTITGNVLDLLDLDRVEVLRGPQGTLAGRNAIGGAIKLFTRKPDGSNDGFTSLTYGDFNRVDLKAAAGFTILEDKLFARIAGSSRNSDGYVTRLDYACQNNLPAPGTPGGLPTYAPSFGCGLGTEGGQSYTSGRVSLRWVVSDNFEINVAASITNDDSESTPGVLLAAKDKSAAFVDGTLVPIWYDNDGDGVFTAGMDVPYDNRFATGGTYTNYATYINDGTSTPHPGFQGGTPGADTNVYKPYVMEPINELKAWDASINIDWQLTDNISLLSVTAVRRYKNFFAEDTDGSPLAVQQLLQVLDHEQWSQELRLNASLFDGYADVTLGFFYLDQDTAEDARVDLPYVGFDFLHGPDLVPSTNKAVYGQVILHPWENIDFTAGLRYSKDEKSYTFRRRNPDLTPVLACTAGPFFFAGNPSGCGVFGLDRLPVSYSSNSLDWRTALSYNVNDDVMVYGQIASGYKGGGNNARPFFPSQLNAFDPEELLTYEAGIKSTWAGQLRMNMAVFWNDYTSIQLPTNVCTWADVGQQVPCASQNNVGDAEVWGFELEVEWVPTDAITIDAAYSHLDHEYSRIAEVSPGVPATAVTIDMVPPYTPENKWSLGVQYEMSLGNYGTLTPRLDVTWQDDIQTAAFNATTNLIDSYTLLNARVTWRSVDDDWQIDFEATNLTDEYYYVTLFDLWETAAGYIHGQPGRPSEWAVTIKRRF